MGRALIASMIATAFISGVLYANGRLDLLPEFDLFAELGAFNARFGLPTTEQAVWLTHGIIGVVIYGVMYAVLRPILPGGGGLSGLVFGIITWLIMMVSFMPLSGHELFAQDLGPHFIGASAALHALFGLILGISYAALSDGEA